MMVLSHQKGTSLLVETSERLLMALCGQGNNYSSQTWPAAFPTGAVTTQIPQSHSSFLFPPISLVILPAV